MYIEIKLKELILEKYKSIRDFSIAIGMPASTIDTILKRGLNKAAISNVIKISKALNISVDALADDKIVFSNSSTTDFPLTIEEQELVKKYRNLDDHDKKALAIIIAGFIGSKAQQARQNTA